MTTVPPLIEARDVRKTYGQGAAATLAIDGVSFGVAPGEVALVVGPSGSGKTTLLSMLGCILRPTGGAVLLDGSDVTGLPDRDLSRVRRDYIGFVFQSFNLLRSLTVLENVLVALDVRGQRGPGAVERARHVLEEAGLADKLDAYPADLSGGQKQRVSIARAVVTDPRLVLADEPTGNLDSRTGHTIAGMLRALATERRAAVIIVTHDERLVDVADRVVRIEDGRIAQ